MIHYRTLQISKNASSIEVTKSYKNLALRYHPNVCPSNESEFKKISESYNILKNENLRSFYDTFGDNVADILQNTQVCDIITNIYDKVNIISATISFYLILFFILSLP